MPPRKRTTRGSQKKSNVESERDKKKQMFLKDFDKQVEKQLAEMQQDRDIMLKKISQEYNLKRMALPVSIRTMKFDDFLALNCDVELALRKVEEGMEKTLDDNIEKKLADMPPKLPRTSKKKVAVVDKLPVPGTSRQTRTTRKKAGFYSDAVVESSLLEANDQSFATVKTIELKFPPNKTPATAFRKARYGEISYSIRGSPIMNGKIIGERYPAKNDDKREELYDNRDNSPPKQRN